MDILYAIVDPRVRKSIIEGNKQGGGETRMTEQSGKLTK